MQETRQDGTSPQGTLARGTPGGRRSTAPMRRAGVKLGLVLAGLAGAGLALPPLVGALEAGSEEPVLIDSYGVWTLERLGYGDLDLPVDAPHTQRSVVFRLPPGAAQGRPRSWYLIHFHLRIRFAREAGDGSFALVWGAPNGRPAASAEFEPRFVRGAFRVPWSTVDMRAGTTRGVSDEAEFEVRHVNFLTYDGVRPGVNTLDFVVEQFRGAKIESVTILRDTAIELSPYGPPKLRLRVKAPRHPVVRRPFSIRYRLERISRRLPVKVVVGVVEDDYSLRVLEPSFHRYPRVDRPVTGRFRLRSPRDGGFLVALAAQSPAGGPLKPVRLYVYPARR